MRYYIENETLKIEIESLGAEIKSVLNKCNYREYMWYGNGKYWGRTSPVLFPFVGSLKEKKYSWKGTLYPMGQHGFARDMEFQVVEQKEQEIWFSLSSNETTYQKYPFHFQLEIGYTLVDNQVEVQWRVVNNSDETMYFSIGAHPAFLCPVHGEKDKIGYKLFFDGVDEIHHHGNVVETGMALREDLVLPLQNGTATITERFFDRCTYMIEGNQTGLVALLDPEDRKIIEMEFDTPLFAIWSPEGKNAPFICIEPWYGRCDADDFSGDLSQREFTNTLNQKEQFEASYKIRFFEC